MLSAYLSSLSRSKTPAAFPQVMKVHSQIVKDSHEEIRPLQNALFLAYIKCRALDEASMLFSQIYHDKNESSWAHLIKAYACSKQPEIAIRCFHQMCSEGNLPQRLAFIGILGCFSESCCSSLDMIKQIHVRIFASGLHTDVVIATNLVNIYGRNHAQHVFDSRFNVYNHSTYYAQQNFNSRINVKFDRTHSLYHVQHAFDHILEPDVVLWTALITVYVQAEHEIHAFHLLQKMQMEGVMPNEFTYASILSASHGSVDLRNLESIHACVICSVYGSDIVVCNGLIHMYAKCHSFDEAVMIFNDMDDRNVVSWNAMITACNYHNNLEKVLMCIKHMQERGVFPDEITFISAFDVFANHASITEGKQTHTHLINMELDVGGLGLNLGNSLLNMYGKCGSIELARSVFDSMSCRNVTTWTTMIASYAQQGLGEEALDLAPQMWEMGIIPNSITFVNLLNACSHSGLLNKACEYFITMRLNGIIPSLEHYNCMVDLMARVGLLNEGEMFLESMPIEANSTLWTTLLGGCRLHFDVERGERTVVHVLQLGIEEVGPYVWLWNTLS